MTTVQRVAQIFGVVFILLALLGFFQGMSMESSLLLGLFPVNLLHNVVHLLFGLWGLLASRTFAGAKTYAHDSGDSKRKALSTSMSCWGGMSTRWISVHKSIS